MYTWTRDYRVDLACAEYTAGVQGDGRPAAYTNGAAGSPIYAYCRFRPGIAIEAPGFLFELGKYYDDSASFHTSLGLYDADYDSLSASLMAPLDTAMVPAPLGLGYAAGAPLGAGYAVDWNSRTGNLNVVSQAGSQSVIAGVAVEVVEFAGGVRLGEVFFEMPFAFLAKASPANPLPSLVTPQLFDSLNGGQWLDSFSISTQLNQHLEVQLKAVDVMGDSTQVTHPTNLPGAIFYNVNDDPTKRRDTVRDIDPVAVLEWDARQGGHFSLGLELRKRPALCGPTESATYQLSVHVTDTCIWVDFPDDTLYACVGDTLDVSPQIRGNFQGPLDYLWDDASQNASASISSPGIHWVLVRDTINGCSMRDTVVVVWTDECVWPGDANFDGVANNHDILPVGLAYGRTGPARPYAGTLWQATPAFAFGDTTPGGIDMAHADTDGNRIVGASDTAAILLNYNLQHNKTSSSDSLGCLLFIQTPSLPVSVGDTLRLPVFLGVDTAAVDSAYGLAFSINYTQRLVDSGKVRFHIPDSTWLGSRAELLSIQYDSYTTSKIDLGITRTSHTNRASFGQIARMDIVVIDDIIGKKVLQDTLELRFEDIELVTAAGYRVEVNGIPSSIIVEDEDVTTGHIPDAFEKTKIYPRPVSDRLIIDHPSSGSWKAELYNVQGKLLMTFDGNSGINSIPMSGYKPGVYLLRLQQQSAFMTTRIIRVP